MPKILRSSSIMSSGSFVWKSFNHAWSVDGIGEIAEGSYLARRKGLNFRNLIILTKLLQYTPNGRNVEPGRLALTSVASSLCPTLNSCPTLYDYHIHF